MTVYHFLFYVCDNYDVMMSFLQSFRVEKCLLFTDSTKISVVKKMLNIILLQNNM